MGHQARVHGSPWTVRYPIDCIPEASRDRSSLTRSGARRGGHEETSSLYLNRGRASNQEQERDHIYSSQRPPRCRASGELGSDPNISTTARIAHILSMEGKHRVVRTRSDRANQARRIQPRSGADGVREGKEGKDSELDQSQERLIHPSITLSPGRVRVRVRSPTNSTMKARAAIGRLEPRLGE